METVATGLLVASLILAFASLLFGLPGTWMILGAAGIYAWATGFESLTLPWFIPLTLAALAGELLEYLLGLKGATRFGASRGGAFASLGGGLLGTLLGAPLFFGLGALIGLFAGAFLGAFGYEWYRQRNLTASIRSGYGAFLGRVSGTLAKLFLALGMIVLVLWKVFRSG